MRAGFTGQGPRSLIEYTADAERPIELPSASPYAAMIDHVLACLNGHTDNQLRPPWRRPLPFAGLDARAAELIRLGSNATFRLRGQPIAARVGRTANRLADARREVAVSRWLSSEDVPAIRALDLEQPVVADGRVVTFGRRPATRWSTHSCGAGCPAAPIAPADPARGPGPATHRPVRASVSAHRDGNDVERRSPLPLGPEQPARGSLRQADVRVATRHRAR